VHQLGQKSIQGKALTVLEQKLYQQIHDHYQVSQQALSMQQSGTVQVSFLLLPSGYAQQVHLQQASIYPLLNQAALAAVTSAQPFHLGKQHLSQPQTFQIPVVFQGGP
jgi:TonB family protein